MSETQSSTTQAARDVGGQGKEAAKDVASTATDQATQVAREARDQARNLLSQSRSELTDQASQQQSRISQSLRGIADELHSMANNSEQDGMATGLVREAAGHAHNASRWLEDRVPASVLEEVRGFARRRPGTFLAAAAILGVVGGRLTRATVDEKRDDSSGGASNGTPPTHSTAGFGAPAATGAVGTGDGFPTAGVETTGTTASPATTPLETPGYGTAAEEDITAGGPLGDPASEVGSTLPPEPVRGPVGAPRDDEVLP